MSVIKFDAYLNIVTFLKVSNSEDEEAVASIDRVVSISLTLLNRECQKLRLVLIQSRTTEKLNIVNH